MPQQAITPPPSPLENSQEVVLFELENARSLVNIVSDGFRDSIYAAQRKYPELFEMEERTLWKELRDRKQMPVPTDNRLRAAFWYEYNRAQNEVCNMNLTSVYAGVCTREFFHRNYVTNAYKMAWLMCPPTSYTIIMQEALTFGIDQLREILEEPTTVNGKFNAALANLKLKIVAMMDLRLKGGIVQKNLNLNVTTGDSGVSGAATLRTMDEIEVRMRELEKRERKALNLPIEVPASPGEKTDDAQFVEAEVVHTES